MARRYALGIQRANESIDHLHPWRCGGGTRRVGCGARLARRLQGWHAGRGVVPRGGPDRRPAGSVKLPGDVRELPVLARSRSAFPSGWDPPHVPVTCPSATASTSASRSRTTRYPGCARRGRARSA
jgi:hypothetical protein